MKVTKSLTLTRAEIIEQLSGIVIGAITDMVPDLLNDKNLETLKAIENLSNIEDCGITINSYFIGLRCVWINFMRTLKIKKWRMC